LIPLGRGVYRRTPSGVASRISALITPPSRSFPSGLAGWGGQLPSRLVHGVLGLAERFLRGASSLVGDTFDAELVVMKGLAEGFLDRAGTPLRRALDRFPALDPLRWLQ
jgi:hypothetical protein